MKSAWDILGLSPGAGDEEIGGAYRRWAKVLHPDTNKRPTATTEFKELQKAYEILKDPVLREKHNYALAKVEAADVEDDAVDAVLSNYSLEPKKKKKKKKKKSKETAQAAPQPQPYYHQPYVPPQPQYASNGQFGRGEFEGIPTGYDSHDDLGGIL